MELASHITPASVPVHLAHVAGRVLLSCDVEIADLIAEGANAQVFLLRGKEASFVASSPELVFKTCSTSSLKQFSRMMLEASVQSSAAACPYIAPVIAAAVVDELVGFIMPRYAIPANVLIGEEENAPKEAISVIGYSISSALNYLHLMKISHNDVKLENVLISHSGRVVLADAGLSSSLSRKESFNKAVAVSGTRPYISPEMFWRTASKKVIAGDLGS